jgi:hypothetical protein
VPLILRGWCSSLCCFIHRVTLIVPALAPAKALRSGAPVTTRQRSLRAPRATASTAVMSEPSRDTAVATGPQQEETAAVAAATAATVVASASPALVPAAGDQAVVDVTDDDAPPPGWGQWGN